MRGASWIPRAMGSGLLASTLLMSACAAAPDETPLVPDGTSWSLDTAAAGPLAKSGSASGVTLVFGPDGVSGNGGCNQYRATYTLDAATLRFGPVGATKRGCMDDRAEIERTWFGVLGGALEVSREGDRLVLRDAAGVSYSFVATPVQTKP